MNPRMNGSGRKMLPLVGFREAARLCKWILVIEAIYRAEFLFFSLGFKIAAEVFHDVYAKF